MSLRFFSFFEPLWLNRPASTQRDKSSQTFALPAICSSIDCACFSGTTCTVSYFEMVSTQSDTTIFYLSFLCVLPNVAFKWSRMCCRCVRSNSWHWLNQPYGMIERTCWEKSVNPLAVIRPTVWIYPSRAGVFTPRLLRHPHVISMFFTLGTCIYSSILEPLFACSICCKTKIEHFYCRCFPPILILPSIFQCLLRKKSSLQNISHLSLSSSSPVFIRHPEGDSFT